MYVGMKRRLPSSPSVELTAVAYREDRSVSEPDRSERMPFPDGTAEGGRGAAEDRAEAPAAVPAGDRGPRTEDAPAKGHAPARQGQAESADTAKGKGGRKRLVMIALAFAALFGGGYYGWSYWTDGRFLVSTGDAYGAGDITLLAAEVSGYISAVEVQNDQPVKAGEVVFRIDDGDYKLAVQSARDKLATLQSTVDRIEKQAAAARAQVAQALPQIDAAKSDGIRAQLEYDRQTKLARSDFASKAKFEQARADRDRTVAAVKSAEAALAVARANVDVLEAQRVEAARSADEAGTELAKAERDLSFTAVRAPVSGIVGNRAIQVGSYVVPGTRLAALVPLDTVHIDANYKETQLGPIRPGQLVRLEVDAYPGREVAATVESIAPASGSQYSLLPPENATGNFTKIVQRVPVRVKVDPKVAAQGFLRPGMSVVVKVDIRDPKAAAAAHPFRSAIRDGEGR